MNKRHVLFLTAVLGMASFSALAQTDASAAPSDPQLRTANITLETGTYQGPLSSLLAAIAKTAGYGLILDTDVDQLQGTPAAGTTTLAASGRPMIYSFQDKPFNEVWPLLMDVYGLSYEVIQVGGQPVLRVGNAPIQRVVALKNADAVEAANQVKLFFGTPTYTETPQKDAQGNVIGVTRTLADVKLDSATLRIVPDVRSNSVIVRGTNKEVADVSRVLAQLDSTDATKTDTTTTQPAAGSQTVQRVYAVKGKQGDIVTLLSAQYPGLKITPVGDTGQLVITGPQNQIEAATALLTQVDKPTPPPAPVATAPAAVQRVFQLVNASAEEVKATLEGTLARDVASTTSTGPNIPLYDPTTGLIYGSDAVKNAVSATTATNTAAAQAANTAKTETPATIIADKRTNTLIVRGTQAQVDQVAELVPQLDKVVPQINLQVRIQELSDTASRNLGLNAKLNFGGFTVTTNAANGLAATFDPTQSFVGFNIFPTLTALESQALTKRVYDGSITMQSGQRSLTSATGGSQNSSNTAAASVKSGGRLEINIPAGSFVAAIQKQIDYGVNLDFFDPQVAPDGTITVRVRGQVNNPKTQISANSVPYILDFQNSEAQSIITFKNGETVLLTGLMGNENVNNNTGLPFMSQLGIGGNTSKQTKFSQLLVIITGNIVK